MKYTNNGVENLKIAYIGGGSRGWAWTLMNDLAKAEDLSGTVYLYDIDYNAAKANEEIGKQFPGNRWDYLAVETIGEALTGADFVIISILPGTFDEMEYDVHAPEKYGIYQSVGDTAGPGGFIRALRTVPMMRKIAASIRTYCPKAWVINYTNPMAVCIGALYREFPEIRAYGCCHEVFGTQKLLMNALEEMEGITDISREEIT
ncbi:MAG: alpha-glucosidase/alpha-galactosidase, partial [Clostridia bacterium]|nr:alpha-glucosidase/alpha-galactosidase [Clostridia bacterium]